MSGTAAIGTTVCLSGLLRAEASLATILLCESPPCTVRGRVGRGGGGGCKVDVVDERRTRGVCV
jgi:hypothetical protein